jgi:hypothetical protein
MDALQGLKGASPFLVEDATEGSDTATPAGASQYGCGYTSGYQVQNQFVVEGQEVQYTRISSRPISWSSHGADQPISRD